MTIYEFFKGKLIERGFFANQAEGVLEASKQSQILDSMILRWDDEAEGYPAQLLTAVWVEICAQAVIWIDANLPMAWFRPLFAEWVMMEEAR